MVAQRAKDHGLAVGRPSIDLIVVTPARRKRAASRVKRELLGNAAGDGNHVNLLIAVVLTGESDPLAIGRELGEELDPGMGGESRREPAGGRGEPEIAAIRKDDPVSMDIRKAQKVCLRRGKRSEEK